MSWDGKMYDKYKIEHTDGTPLKGKKYFVLRLDSDDPIEMARVTAAMRAYKNEPRNCDVGTLTEQQKRFSDYCRKMQHTDKACCGGCPIVHLRLKGVISNSCELAWEQMPYEGAAE